MKQDKGITMITPEVRARVQAVLAEAGRVVIGAGWGLSCAAGLAGLDAALSEAFAPLKEAGLATYAQAEAALETSDERYWGYWFRRIKELRFTMGRSAVYDDLLALVADKDYAVITSTVDGLFYKSSFEEQRVYPVQGDLSRLQCAQGCTAETYSVLPYLRKALSAIDDGTLVLPEALRPRCPHCGAALAPNISSTPHFCHAPYQEQARLVNHYLRDTEAGPLVLLEVGVGYSEPNLIRFPFEFLTESRQDVTLIRINDRYPLCAEENRAKAICIGLDAAQALHDLAAR